MDEFVRVYHVYILSSDSKRLYIGVTSRLEKRIRQHKEEFFPDCFTALYNIKRLVYSSNRENALNMELRMIDEIAYCERLISTTSPHPFDLSKAPIFLERMISRVATVSLTCHQPARSRCVRPH